MKCNQAKGSLKKALLIKEDIFLKDLKKTAAERIKIATVIVFSRKVISSICIILLFNILSVLNTNSKTTNVTRK
jgi:hypothetical protein